MSHKQPRINKKAIKKRNKQLTKTEKEEECPKLEDLEVSDDVGIPSFGSINFQLKLMIHELLPLSDRFRFQRVNKLWHKMLDYSLELQRTLPEKVQSQSSNSKLFKKCPQLIQINLKHQDIFTSNAQMAARNLYQYCPNLRSFLNITELHVPIVKQYLKLLKMDDEKNCNQQIVELDFTRRCSPDSVDLILKTINYEVKKLDWKLDVSHFYHLFNSNATLIAPNVIDFKSTIGTKHIISKLVGDDGWYVSEEGIAGFMAQLKKFSSEFSQLLVDHFVNCHNLVTLEELPAKERQVQDMSKILSLDNLRHLKLNSSLKNPDGRLWLVQFLNLHGKHLRTLDLDMNGGLPIILTAIGDNCHNLKILKLKLESDDELDLGEHFVACVKNLTRLKLIHLHGLKLTNEHQEAIFGFLERTLIQLKNN